MRQYKVFANGFNMGIFEGDDEDAALEAYAQEAGYESVADMDERLGSDAEYDVVEVSTSDKKQGEEKKMKKFKVVVNHFDMGIFEGEDEHAALEAWAQDAGYASFADMNEQTETEKPDEYEVVEMDADALEAYAQKAGYASFAEMEEELGSDAKHDVVEVSTSDKKQGEEKKMKQYKIYVNHFNMGVFEAEDETAALEAYAQDAGYDSLADLEEQLETEKPDEYEVVEMEGLTC